MPTKQHRLIVCILGISFIGAGCSSSSIVSTKISEPAAPSPATVAVSSKPPVIIFNGKTFETTAILYDNVGHGDLAEWALTRSVADQILKTRSCKPLNIRDQTIVSLPLEFQSPSLCSVIQRGSDTILVAVGLGITYESFPHISSMAFVLRKDDALLVQGVLRDFERSVNTTEIKKFDITKVEFPSKEFQEIYNTAEKDFIAQLTAPSKEMQSAFADLKKAAEKIEVK